MKKLFWIFVVAALVIPSASFGLGIVKQGGVTSEDSLAINVINADSAGFPIGKFDSLFIFVVGPSGDSITAVKQTTTGASGGWTSYYKRFFAVPNESLLFIKGRVADLVNTSSYGNYTVICYTHNNTKKTWTITREPFQYVATHAAGLFGVDVRDWLGSAVDTTGATGRIHVNVKTFGGTTVTARDIGASVLLSSGSSAGQLDFTNGVVKANATQLLGTTISTPATNGVMDVNIKNWCNVVVHNTQGNTLNDTLPHVSLAQIEGVNLATHAAGMAPADMRDILGTAVSTPATAGILDVNVKNMGNSTLSATSAQVGVNVVAWNNTTVATPATAGIPDVNVKNWGNTAAASAAFNTTNLAAVMDLDTTGHAVVKSLSATIQAIKAFGAPPSTSAIAAAVAAPSAATIAAAVLDADTTGHHTANSLAFRVAQIGLPMQIGDTTGLRQNINNGRFNPTTDSVSVKMAAFLASLMIDSSNTNAAFRHMIANHADSLNNFGIRAAIDSMWWASGNKSNAWYYQHRHNDVDTAFFGIGSTIYWMKIYFHTGGVPGRWPDSVKTVGAP